VTGLIYVAIIAVWAVVLVPAWLRRHDHLDPERSVDRFSRSMRTLAQRPSVLGIPLAAEDADPHREVGVEPEVVTPRRPEPAQLVGGHVARAQLRLQGAAGQASSRVRGTSAAARRRVVLGVLLASLVVMVGLAVGGLVAPVAVAAPAVLTVGFLGVARHQVRAAQQRRSAPAPRVAEPHRASAAQPAARGPVSGATGGTWEPQATPLPTYVTKPPAAEFPRVIDTEPGAWTAAAMLKRAEEQKARAERMAQAKAEAIARARAEQAAAEARSRDEEYLEAQRAEWRPAPRAVNE
jgi:hypothetical protein